MTNKKLRRREARQAQQPKPAKKATSKRAAKAKPEDKEGTDDE
jgi:hypothetical protein